MTSTYEQRERYARRIVASARVAGPMAERLVALYRDVPRERFAGSGFPLARVYSDALIPLDSRRGINNGQPSLHAACLAALDPKPGETGVHVGAGSGYYTAMLAELVGREGHVHAYEIEPGIARLARVNLREYSWVRVEASSGAAGALPACDFVYVSAGATHPAAVWLDALRPGGRVLFPLTPEEGFGGMLLLTQRTREHYAARFVCGAKFIACQGARDDEGLGKRLAAAFVEGGEIWLAASFHRGSKPDANACFEGSGWWLSTVAS